MMQDQTDKSQTFIPKQEKKPLLSLSSKTIAQALHSSQPSLYYSLAAYNYCEVDLQSGKITYESPAIHEAKIAAINEKQNIIITGSHDHTVKLFDVRSHELIHCFRKIPGQFNCVDRTQHILAAGCGSNVIFWDLRKMKQRSQFKDSFQQDVTCIKFDTQIQTNLFGCSLDGMINQFDLTQPNEEDAFSWCFKIVESAENLKNFGNLALVQTTDHILYKIEEGECLGKIAPNHPQKPKHIIYTEIMENRYRYGGWNINESKVQIWEGQMQDKNNKEICKGYINNVNYVDLLTILNNCAIYTNESGQMYIEKISEREERTSFANKEENMLQEETVFVNKNGYILKKQSMLKNKNPKKFRPY